MTKTKAKSPDASGEKQPTTTHAHKFAVGDRLRVASSHETQCEVLELVDGDDGPCYRTSVQHPSFKSKFECVYGEENLEPLP